MFTSYSIPKIGSLHKGFRQHSMVNANASDYPTLDQTRLHQDIKFNTLDIYHHTVNGNGEKIDLSLYLHYC